MGLAYCANRHSYRKDTYLISECRCKHGSNCAYHIHGSDTGRMYQSWDIVAGSFCGEVMLWYLFFKRVKTSLGVRAGETNGNISQAHDTNKWCAHWNHYLSDNAGTVLSYGTLRCPRLKLVEIADGGIVVEVRQLVSETTTQYPWRHPPLRLLQLTCPPVHLCMSILPMENSRSRRTWPRWSLQHHYRGCTRKGTLHCQNDPGWTPRTHAHGSAQRRRYRPRWNGTASAPIKFIFNNKPPISLSEWMHRFLIAFDSYMVVISAH